MGAVAAIGDAIGTFFATAGAATAEAVGLSGTSLLGVSTGTLIGDTLGGIAGGAALGAGEGALTGGNILKDAGLGALGGAVTGFAGPLIGSTLDIGAVPADALAGAAGGAISGVAGGTNPLTGALTGAASGALAGSLSGSGATTTPETSIGASAGSGAGLSSSGPGASAVATAAPSTVGLDTTNLNFSSAVDGAGNPINAASPTAQSDVSGGLTNVASATASPTTTLSSADSTALTNQLGIAGNGPANLALVQNATTPVDQTPTSGFDQTPPQNTPTASPTASPVANFTDPNTFPVPPTPPDYVPPADSNVVGNSAGTGTPSAAPNAGGTPNGGNSIGNFIHNPSLDTLGNAVSSNANLLLPAALMGYQALNANKGLSAIPGYNQVANTANNLTAQSQQLTSYLTSGTLPPGVQQGINQAGAAAKAAIRSQYASRGMTGSSAEAQDLANVDNTLVSQGAQIATQLLQTGVSEAQLGSQLYSQIMQSQLAQDNQLAASLATLAGAAARPTVNVTGNPTG